MILNLTVYIRNAISFSYKQKARWNSDIYNFFGEKLNLAFISLKLGNLGKIGNYDVIVTSYTRCLSFW